MKTWVTSKPAWMAAALGMLAACGNARAQDYIYDNSTADLGLFLNPGGPSSIVADEINLGLGPRSPNQISVSLSGLGTVGDNESLGGFLYALDGPPDANGSGFASPGTIIGTFGGPLGWGTGDHYAQWFTFDLTLSVPALPDTIAVGLDIAGADVAAGEIVGPHLYDPPTIGASIGDYWWLQGSPLAFGLTVLGTDAAGLPDPAANLGIRIIVPEASTVWGLGGLGALIGLTLCRRFCRKS